MYASPLTAPDTDFEQAWSQVQVDGRIMALMLAMVLLGTIAPAGLNYVLVQQVGATRAALASASATVT